MEWNGSGKKPFGKRIGWRKKKFDTPLNLWYNKKL